MTAVPVAAEEPDWYVNAAVSESGDGTSLETAFKTIQEGVNAAGTGDTVNVVTGTYNEQVIIEYPASNISLVGAGRDSTTIDAGSKRWGAIDIIGASHITISGFTLRNRGEAQSQDDGINIVAYGFPATAWSTYITVEDCTLDADEYGIRVHNYSKASHNIFRRNIITSDSSGIHLEYTSQNTVTQNTISSATGFAGINLGIAGDDNAVQYNKISGCKYGVNLVESQGGPSGNVISNNEITNNERGIWWQRNPANVIEYNNIFNNTAYNLYAGSYFTLEVPAPAENNWWGQDPPDAAKFYGTVDYDPCSTSPNPIVPPPTEVWVDDDFTDSENDGGHEWGIDAFAIIQEGVAAVAEAGTVNVEAGEYNETVVLKDTTALGISIIGQDKTNTFITEGIGFAADYSGLKVQNFTITGNGFLGTETYEATVSNVWPGHRIITDLEFSDCIFDGEGYDDGEGGRCGIVIKRLGGVVKFVNNDFKNYPGWATLDVNDGSGEGALTVTSYTLIDNDFLDNRGGCALRGNLGDYTDTAIVTGNTFDGPAGWAALEVNRAENVEIYDNEIRNVEEYLDWEEGQAMQLWQVGTVEIYENTIENNYQGVAILNYPDPYDISNISIYHNSFSGNAEYALSVGDGLIGGPLNATNNWWGSASGPTHASNTYTVPAGTPQGAAVSDYVDYVPWYNIDKTGASFAPVENTDTEEQFSSIQAAIDDADTDTDDTIFVAAGTYKEHITIDESDLNLVGEDREITIIDATQDSLWDYPKPGILLHNVDDVTVSGFTIQDAAVAEDGQPFVPLYGPGPRAKAAILIYGSSDSNAIENNILINNCWGVFVCAEGQGTTKCKNNRVANNIIRDGVQDGVYLYTDGVVPVENTEIVTNEIYNRYGTSASGVEFWAWSETAPENLAITGTVIRGNNITNCTYGVRVRDDVEDTAGTSINYNNFVDSTSYGIYNGVASTLDATHNYWGHASGPSRELTNGNWVGKKGDKVSEKVNYKPWLHKSKEKAKKEPAYAQSVDLDKTGAYGWNTFSAPIFLDEEADTWAELFDLADELAYSLAYRFDSDNQTFVPLLAGDNYTITPGEGFFIKMKDVGSLPILYSTAWNPIPPTRPLTAGWNLIGLASLKDMPVEDAFFSLSGEGQIVSPTWNKSPGAVFAGGTIYVGEAYWVYMLGERTLAGFTMTPVDWEE